MPARYPRRADDVAYRMVDDEMVLVSASRGTIYSLNPVGAFIWEMADDDNSLDDIVSAVCERYDVDKEDALADADGFLGELERNGALSVIER